MFSKYLLMANSESLSSENTKNFVLENGPSPQKPQTLKFHYKIERTNEDRKPSVQENGAETNELCLEESREFFP